MKRLLLIIMSVVLLASCGQGQKIKVAVFQGDGGAATCIRETVAALSLDEDMEVRIVHSSDIAAGVLDSLDAIVIPGGGGSRQYLSLGQTNMALIKDFVHRGGGAVGICAGAYLFSNTPDYTCMALTGARAIDREHDNRGHGMAKYGQDDSEQGRKEDIPRAGEGGHILRLLL